MHDGMMSEGRWWAKEAFLFDNDFSDDLDGFIDDMGNVFEHSNMRSAILGTPSLVMDNSTVYHLIEFNCH